MKADPGIPVALLRSAMDPDPVATAKALGVVAYNPAWTAIKPRPEAIEALNAAGIAVMPYTVDNAAEWPLMRDAGVDAIITNRPGELIGWGKRYAQEAKPAPLSAHVLAPGDGTTLRRGEDASLALSGAESVAVALDGKAVEEGARIDTDALALGAHEVSLVARGADRGEARTTATFTLRASAGGLAHRIATAPGIASDRLRLRAARGGPSRARRRRC